MVARFVRDEEVKGSNPFTPTFYFSHNDHTDLIFYKHAEINYYDRLRWIRCFVLAVFSPTVQTHGYKNPFHPHFVLFIYLCGNILHITASDSYF